MEYLPFLLVGFAMYGRYNAGYKNNYASRQHSYSDLHEQERFYQMRLEEHERRRLGGENNGGGGCLMLAFAIGAFIYWLIQQGQAM